MKTTTKANKTKCSEKYGAKNLEMSRDVYKLRRQVMKIIYQAHDIAGYRLDRVDVRVTTDNDNFAGLATLGEKVIWINEKYISSNSIILKRIVLHELVHAIFGVAHIDGCLLMDADCFKFRATEKQIEDKFREYARD